MPIKKFPHSSHSLKAGAFWRRFSNLKIYTDESISEKEKLQKKEKILNEQFEKSLKEVEKLKNEIEKLDGYLKQIAIAKEFLR